MTIIDEMWSFVRNDNSGEQAVHIIIKSPLPPDDIDWNCEMQMIINGNTISRKAYGVNSFDAFVFAIAMLVIEAGSYSKINNGYFLDSSSRTVPYCLTLNWFPLIPKNEPTGQP